MLTVELNQSGWPSPIAESILKTNCYLPPNLVNSRPMAAYRMGNYQCLLTTMAPSFRNPLRYSDTFAKLIRAEMEKYFTPEPKTPLYHTSWTE